MVHSVTKKRTNYMFLIEELPCLNKLPQSEFSGLLMKNRKVNWDSLNSILLNYLYEQRTHSAIRDLRVIINLLNYYNDNDNDIENALKTCINWKKCSYKIISQLLRGREDTCFESSVGRLSKYIKNINFDDKSVKRSLGEYNELSEV